MSAVYPVENDMQNVSNNYTWDVKNKQGENADLLLAQQQLVTYDSKNTVSFTFKHAMHKLTIKLVPGNGVTPKDIESVKLMLNAYTSCLVNLVQGTVTSTVNTLNQLVANTANSEVSFILPPQTIQEQTLSCTLSNSKTSSLKLSELMKKIRFI